MYFKNEISKMVAFNNKKIESTTNQLKTCPKGTLQNGFAYGKPFLIQYIKAYGKRHRIRLANNPEICAGLIRKIVLKEELRQLYANGKALDNFKSSYHDFDINKEVLKLETRFPALSQEVIYEALRDRNISNWGNESYEQSTFMPEAKVHTTSRGLKVRSKSEALIAEKLYQYDLPFRYEQILHIDNFTFAPDFTIRRNDGKIFIWEHEGLTNEKAYLEKQLRKSQIYATAGIVPWDNFIVTYDNANGDIDLRIVESEILNKLVF